MRIGWLGFAVGILGIASLAFGQSPAVPPANPCKADIKQYCGDVKVGKGRLARCLERHEDSLTAACKTFMQERRAKHRAEAKACKDDVEKFCGGLKPGGGNLVACLRQHEADLSPPCKQEIPEK